ncbi:MAG: exodeoxyribonuclease V subunit gamma [SAR324 cluster bacterium]|nr:exodeoxyribonuclease V subunit gamma [SAR324 cluster bacterium]
MPKLYYSNDLTIMAGMLAENLADEDPFDTGIIVVPNFSLQQWLSLQIASLNGIAANLSYVPLEKAILSAIVPSSQKKNITLLHPGSIQLLLVSLLHEKLHDSDPVWTPLKDYIFSHEQLQSHALEVRIFQLAAKLSNLFQQYEYLRWDMLAEWKAGRTCFTEPALTTERWQKALWLGVFGENGLVEKFNEQVLNNRVGELSRTYWTLPQIVRYLPLASPVQSKKSLHIFGLSYISRFYHDILSTKLEDYYEVSVYTLNPCMEFWEDLESEWESRIAAKKILRQSPEYYDKVLTRYHTPISNEDSQAGELFQHEEDNQFLKAWGRPGRENIRLLNEWGQWEFYPVFHNPLHLRHTILSQIQFDILTREPRKPAPLQLPQDDSLVVMACPNVRREVEIVTNEIWKLLQSHVDLRMNQIAVIIPDMERYQTDVEIVFQSIHRLPYNLIDGVSLRAGRLLDGALKLFGLCLTDYTRKDMFELLGNPNFLKHPDDPEIDLELWLDWAEKLGIFYGISETDNRERGFQHLKDDLYNWEQGLNRLNLGMFLSVSPDDPKLFELRNRSCVPLTIEAQHDTQAQWFMTLIRSLIADTRSMRNWQMTGDLWGKYLHTLFTTYFAPLNDTEQDEYSRIANSLLEMREFEVLGKSAVGFSVVYEFFKQSQDEVSMHRGRYLAEGVTISSFLPMRPIPFDVVFILGLGEGQFPALDQKDNLDLRQARRLLHNPVRGKAYRDREIGDVSNAEKDKYMFLEIMVSTRKKLYLSYISRNDKTDDPLNPSSVVQSLIGILDTEYLAGRFQQQVHPLKNYDSRYFPELKPQPSETALHSFDHYARLQAYARHWREQLQIRTENSPSSAPVLKDQWEKWYWQLTGGKERLRPTSEKELPEKIVISLSQIRQFLECPLQSAARRQLGLFDEEDLSSVEATHEPFGVDHLQEWQLLNRTLEYGMSPAGLHSSLDAWYQQQVRYLELQGQFPSGLFQQNWKKKHLDILNQWFDEFKTVTKHLEVTTPHKVFFGTVRESFVTEALSQHRFQPAFKTTMKRGEQTLQVEIHGQTEWLASLSGNVLCHFTASNIKSKHWLRVFLSAALLRATGSISSGSDSSEAWIISGEDKPARKLLRLDHWTAEQAATWLKQILHAMLAERFDILFPVEAVIAKDPTGMEPSEFNRQFNETLDKLVQGGKGFSSLYGPVTNLEDYSAPENPYELMTQRFGDFFNVMRDP